MKQNTRQGVYYDRIAKIYDRTRPTYPNIVMDYIENNTNISQGDSILEIGSGSGQATMSFANRGYQLVCIEPGVTFGKILKRKAKKLPVTIHSMTFEEFNVNHHPKMDMVLSATAFHWLDSSTKFKRCSEVLKNTGYLVLMWNIAQDMDYSCVQNAYRYLFSFYPGNEKEPLSIEEINKRRVEEIENSTFFSLKTSTMYPWEYTQSKKAMLEGFFTQSSYLSLSWKDKRKVQKYVKDQFNQLDTNIKTKFITAIYIAEKKLV